MIENTQDLLTRLTTFDATCERRFPKCVDSIHRRTNAVRSMIAGHSTLAEIRAEMIEMKGWAFAGSLAGMNWYDKEWDRLIEAFPVPIEEDEIAAHLTNDLAGALTLSHEIGGMLNFGVNR